MSKKNDLNPHSRRTFLRQLGTASAVAMGAPFIIGSGRSQVRNLNVKDTTRERFSANDRVNYALIGAGGMGQGGMNQALRYDGFRLVAACDLYDSRLRRCKERFGEHVDTTKDYREILDREDVDAVLIATPDHWHDTIAIDALRSGKAVYCEKPVTQRVEEAHPVIEAARQSSMPMQVGSQRTSSILYAKARELYLNGAIGELNFVEAYWDRFSATGAWQYSIPPSASPENVDWKTFRKDLPDIPFNATHFFRWRNYDDYGTGVSGDLFVHLFSGLHLILGTTGPNRIYATGGLRYWHDGRDAADMMLGLFDYPESGDHPAFNLALRVNFVDGSGGGSQIRLVGSEGEMIIGGSSVKVRSSKLTPPGMTIGDFSEDIREEYEEYHAAKYPPKPPEVIEPNELEYRAPSGYSDLYDHHVNFHNAIRNGGPVVQDPTFALRAAGPAILAGESQKSGRIIEWNPELMRTV
ncbi:MAG: Gfo/Idh/MocA family oxidoreductase [Balneolaceae bacterium]